MIFEFYWSWYEDYSPTLFEGEDKTQEEWEKDCKKALADSFDEYMEKESGWAQLPTWIKCACTKLEEYGYKLVSPVKYGLFGLYIPQEDRNEVDDDGIGTGEIYHDDDEDQLPEFKEHIKRMKKYNSDFDKELYKDRKKRKEK